MKKGSLNTKLKKIKIILLDVDGVLTDGKIIYDSEGREYKNFHAHDGYGIVRAKQLGLKIGIMSGRSSEIVDKRAHKLGIDFVFQGIEDKLEACTAFIKQNGITFKEIAFIGDDEFDIPLLKAVGFSASPVNAVLPVKKIVNYVAKKEGGNGAAREVIDMILKTQKKI